MAQGDARTWPLSSRSKSCYRAASGDHDAIVGAIDLPLFVIVAVPPVMKIPAASTPTTLRWISYSIRHRAPLEHADPVVQGRGDAARILKVADAGGTKTPSSPPVTVPELLTLPLAPSPMP